MYPPVVLDILWKQPMLQLWHSRSNQRKIGLAGHWKQKTFSSSINLFCTQEFYTLACLKTIAVWYHLAHFVKYWNCILRIVTDTTNVAIWVRRVQQPHRITTNIRWKKIVLISQIIHCFHTYIYAKKNKNFQQAFGSSICFFMFFFKYYIIKVQVFDNLTHSDASFDITTHFITCNTCCYAIDFIR